MSFKKSVIAESNAACGLPSPGLEFHCTLQLPARPGPAAAKGATSANSITKKVTLVVCSPSSSHSRASGTAARSVQLVTFDGGEVKAGRTVWLKGRTRAVAPYPLHWYERTVWRNAKGSPPQLLGDAVVGNQYLRI